MSQVSNKILLCLKEHALIHQVILNTLLARNYVLHELEKLIGVQVDLLDNVRNGTGRLEDESALKLINLFYEVVH